MIDRQPPYSIESEAAVLSAIFVDNKSYTEAATILSEKDFYRESHRMIFVAMSEMFSDSIPIDPITLVDKLKTSGRLDGVGGVEYVSQLMDVVPSAAHVEAHSRQVKEKAQRRRIIEAANQVVSDAYELPIAEVNGRADRLISVMGESASGGFRLIKNSLWDAFDKIEQLMSGNPQRGMLTGFDELDKMLVGFEGGDLVIIAARPSMGKTAFALNVVSELAINHGSRIGVVSLEMSSTALTTRMIASEARVDLQAMRNGSGMQREASERLAKASGYLDSAKIYIDDSPASRLSELSAKITRLVRTEDVEMVVVDYLQLMEGGGESRTQEISQITRGLKLLAQSLDIPLLVLSQLSRKVEERANKRPMLSDLRDSGSIEQDADIVMFLYRPEYYVQDDAAATAKLDGLAEVILAKQRNGPVGSAPLHFTKGYARFDSRDRGSDWKVTTA